MSQLLLSRVHVFSCKPDFIHVENNIKFGEERSMRLEFIRLLKFAACEHSFPAWIFPERSQSSLSPTTFVKQPGANVKRGRRSLKLNLRRWKSERRGRNIEFRRGFASEIFLAWRRSNKILRKTTLARELVRFWDHHKPENGTRCPRVEARMSWKHPNFEDLDEINARGDNAR